MKHDFIDKLILAADVGEIIISIFLYAKLHEVFPDTPVGFVLVVISSLILCGVVADGITGVIEYFMDELRQVIRDECNRRTYD